MAKKEKTLEQFLTPQLRNIARMWPAKTKARDKSKVKVQIGFYGNGNPEYKVMFKCAMCGENNDKTETQMDHIDPVVHVSGRTDWNDFITRLFCNPEGYQTLCRSCHYIKTQAENEIRKENRKKK